MKDLSIHVRKRLAQKNMSQASIGAFSVQLAKQFAKEPENFSGYIRHNQLFLRISSNEDKVKRFLEKTKILKIINERLTEFGYKYVLRDLRVK